MRLLSIGIVTDVTRPRREAPEAETPQHVAYTAFRQMNAEPCLDHTRQIRTAPAHDTMLGQARTSANHYRRLGFLLRCQAWLGTSRNATGQPGKTAVVVAVHPVSQRLAVHAAQGGCLHTVVPIQHQRRSEHAPRCIGITRSR